MKKAALICIATTLFSFTALPAESQAYHANYSNSRVIKQNQTGLFYNDPSYISAGTLSRSARGLAPGMTVGFAASSAPQVRWGGFVRQPGDGLYNGSDGTMRMENGCVNYTDNYLQMELNRMRKQLILQQRQQYLQSMVPRQRIQGNFYIPGSNGSAATYGRDGSVASYSSFR